MSFKNFPMVPYVVYGRGAFEQLDPILKKRRLNGYPMIFLVDETFRNKALQNRVPLRGNDKLIFIDTSEEPKTSYVDSVRDGLEKEFGKVSGVIGIGGGSVLDMAKAVSIMMNNKGNSSQYQGWDLVKEKAVYHVGIPTLSGTGSEVSRTTVLTGPDKKLGINSDYTPFDQVVLDPELCKDVPSDQRFYTGMDCFIHCIESLEGTLLNTFSRSYGEKALELCLQSYLDSNHWTPENDDKMMMASWHGGMSIAYSQVGMAHAMSYGLSFVLGTKHGIGNCIVFNQLGEYYPEGVAKFKKMIEKNNIKIPEGVCADISEEQMEKMIQTALGLTPLWENAFGPDWREKINAEILRELYRKM